MSVKIPKTHLVPPGRLTRILPDINFLSKRKRVVKIDQKDENLLKLTELVSNSEILFKAKTVFPFIIFPDEVIIDKDKVSIVSQIFIGSDRRQSVLIKNIADCFVDSSILFGSLKITDKYFEDNVYSINYLKKSDAIMARDLIQGLVLCHEKEIDISEIKTSDLLPYLIEIGKATET